MESLREVFARGMRARREFLQWSQQDLALRLGVDRNTVSRIERVAPNLTLDRISEICAALEISTSCVFAGRYNAPKHAAGPDKLEFGTLVREQRLALEMSQQQLAEVVGIDRNYVGVVERGGEPTRVNTAQAFMLALKLAPTDVFGVCEADASL